KKPRKPKAPGLLKRPRLLLVGVGARSRGVAFRLLGLLRLLRGGGLVGRGSVLGESREGNRGQRHRCNKSEQSLHHFRVLQFCEVQSTLTAYPVPILNA